MRVHGLLLFCFILHAGPGLAKRSDSDTDSIEGTMVWDNHSTSENMDQGNSKKHQDFKTEKETSTLWFNTTVLLNLARTVSSTSLDNMQKLAYKILHTYDNLLNINSKRAKAISEHLQATGGKLKELEQDTDSVIEDLYEKYETADSEKKPAVKKLLDIALAQREQLSRKKASEYGILECGSVMGKICDSDEDCYGKGCLLQCKTSGYFWWTDSVCR